MSNLLLAALGALLVVTNAYWWRRTRTVRASLTRSHDRDERVAGRVETDPESVATLEAAADRADCLPDQLPDRVTDLESETDRLREMFAASWWDARQREGVDLSEPHVLCVTLPRATTEDVQQFADHTQDYDEEIAIILADAEGTVAVSVGSSLTERFSAEEILADITAEAGGEGGGSATFATGGGVDSDRLGEVAQAVRDRLAEELQ